MVEYALQLDAIFGSLADPTRRDILRRVATAELSISEIAASYNLTFAAISKHLKILEKANLIRKRRQGKQQLVQIAPTALKNATTYLESYEKLWNERFNALEALLKIQE
jgi:DNA-binding transcriptional ArsR family regulator